MIDTTEILQKQYEYMDANAKLEKTMNNNNNTGLVTSGDNACSIKELYDVSDTKHLKNVTIDLSGCPYEISNHNALDETQLQNSIDETNNMSNDYLLRKPSNMKKINLDTFVIKTSDNIKPKILPKTGCQYKNQGI